MPSLKSKLKNKFISFFANLGLKFMSDKSKLTSMILRCRPSFVSEIVIIPVVEMLITRFRKHLSNLKEKGKAFKGEYMDSQSQISIVPITMGAPAAAVYMEALNQTKAKYIFKVDFCGGLAQDIKLGDIIIADSSICGDGTTPHYNLKNISGVNKEYDTVLADQDVLRSLKDYLNDSEIEFKVGPIYTTDAIFKETEKLLEKARNYGAIAIDMETSVLYSLGKVFNKKVISINIVSDIPDPKKKFNLNINSRMIDNMDILVEKVLDFVSKRL
ncbi:MAG: hypothetical protein EU549_01985 [Promethearchaeota archaeon]|nr:MAG: hypothetical protein EU549_01985 [Candidatus Lokiarchaeota archaeon]